ncbi:MAG: hypothetical protein ASARMPRED_000969 [Alectoria sarmentosa]|nr:MAG: hypothetical protein ASARMPRED_000969 [Alectoria sarmentosa]
MPKLLGQDGRLAYHRSIKEKCITKSGYRAYLDMVASKLSHLQTQIKGDCGEAKHFQQMDRQMPRNSKFLWDELASTIKEMEPVLAQHYFTIVKEEDSEMLHMGSESLPKLLGQGGRLMYGDSSKDEKINRSSYKAYLEMVGSNLERLTDMMKLPFL